MSDFDDVPAAMSTSALQAKLKDLKEKSNKHSQILTAKLASSQSGQNLLHIGTSLSSLPPDLHSLLTQLHPVLSSAEATEKQYVQRLEKLVECGNEIRSEQRRVEHARECANLYQDLMAAEQVVKRDANYRRSSLGLLNTPTTTTSPTTEGTSVATDLGKLMIHRSIDKTVVSHSCVYVFLRSLQMLIQEIHHGSLHSYTSYISAKVDHVSSLERCAHITLCLVQDLQSSTDKVTTLTASKVVMTDKDRNDKSLPSLRTALEEDTERAHFLMKLAPRIRRLESDTITALTHCMEQTLRNLQQLREGTVDYDNDDQIPPEDELLLMLGHCMRGLALLGRGKEVENIFARIAIMYVIASVELGTRYSAVAA